MNPALNCGLVLFCLNLLAGNIGDFSPSLRSSLALALWLPVWILQLWPAFRDSTLLRKSLALLLFVPIAWCSHVGGALLLLGFFASLLFFPLLHRRFGRISGSNSGRAPIDDANAANPQAVWALLLLAAAALGCGLILIQNFPLAYSALGWFSTLSSKTATLICRSPIDLGGSYSGASIFLTFALFHLCTFFLSSSGTARLVVKLLAGQWLLLLIYQIGFHRLLAMLKLDGAPLVLGVPQCALFLPSFALIVLHLRRVRLAVPNWQVRIWPLLAFSAASLLFFVCLPLDTFKRFSSHACPRVCLYDDGTLNWLTPVYGQYSGMSGGMFGSLEAFLNRHGCHAYRAPLTNGCLESSDVLVLFNLMHKFSAEQKRMIWDFVQRGGGLLAVGDHTGTTAIREPFNDLLAPVNVEFNFDSAIPIRNRWQHGLRWFPHAVTVRLDSEADAQINVGASLSVSRPSRPLIVGTQGFSDKGNLLNVTNGCLGDMRYSNDERLGDVSLVATAVYGRGKVMVFGDTTTFQNTALPRDADFVLSIMHWLASKSSRLPGIGYWVCLVAAIAAAWWLLRGGGAWPAAIVSLFVSVSLSAVLAPAVLRWQTASICGQLPNGEALVDVSHLSRCDQDLWQPDGLGGLVQNLMRKKYLPQLADRFSPDFIKHSKLIFLVAPAKPFTTSELAVYNEFAGRGGNLFICVGYEDSYASRQLLNHFGLRLRNLPLGKVGPDSDDAKAWFLNAWPVIFECSSAERLCSSGQYPLVVRIPWQRGRVVLIGDSGFFLNRNLEMPFDFNPDNIAFLQKLIPDHE